ncbi:alpha/beta fold hydrolase [Luteitalea sp.]|uniref:alpha/beta fold hydrolase n=1 Tax=Luteitalea sp. TaxID=2004800 RepID=UPI0025BD119E|nr:alpha/beta fold hydrolase [Luteitalea sp.]
MFFGRAPKSLFGVYHPPKAAHARAVGIVLCYPFGQEYMRAHRAFRQMALLLSKAGFHVLRFDYFGTGDSSGETDAVSLSQWVDDAGVAADELRDTAGITRIAFVGLRLGAAVAALAAAKRSDVAEAVLWDPAVRGSDYLAEIFEKRHDSVGGSHSAVANEETAGVMGFPVTQRLRADLEQLDLMTCAAPPGSGRLVIASHDRPEYQQLGAMQTAGAKSRYQVVPSEGSWNEVDDNGGALIPVFLMQAIVLHLTQEVQ